MILLATIVSALSQPALILSLLLVVAIVPQVILTAWFIQMMRLWVQQHRAQSARVQTQTLAVETVPAEVVLCLRGCDSTLQQVFASLARQTQGNWRLRIIVDSQTDPAWNAAHAAVAAMAIPQSSFLPPSWREVLIESLAQRPTTGSLKCASLRQALQSLAPQTVVIALIDADCVVHDDWLETLVKECLQPGVGAVSGNRWYDPEHDSVAGTVRAIWNAAAIVQMTAFGIPWGGSLAVRREAIEACSWVDLIQTTLCEDTALAAPLATSGWKYHFIPSLIAIDTTDDIALVPLTRWISRQLLTARLHHPLWPLVAIHGISTSFSLLSVVVFCLIAATFSHWSAFGVVAGSLVAYEVISLLLVWAIERSTAQVVALAGKQIRSPTVGRRLRWALALPFTQAVYATAIVSAMTTRSVEWRGVTYRIRQSASSFIVGIDP